MTDRLNGCVVIFEQKMRDDDARTILSAIKMIRGVQSVIPDVVTDNMSEWVVVNKTKQDVAKDLYALIDKLLKTN